MTIEERAKAFWDRNEEKLRTIQYEESLFVSGYIAGATEQKDIDHEEWKKDMRFVNVRKQELIDKTCEWLTKYAKDYAEFEPLTKFGVFALVYDLRKAMEL